MVYIALTAATVCQIKYFDPIKSVYNKEHDSFPHMKVAVLPSLVLALLAILYKYMFRYPDFFRDNFAVMAQSLFMEWLWTASILLESIAVLPQLFVLRKYRLVENLPGKFMICLGSYRAMYILNWIYRSYTQPGYQHNWITSICGVVQTLIYVDFFHQYCKARCGGCRKKERHSGGDGVDDYEQQALMDANDDDDNDDGLIFELSTQNNSTERRRQIDSSPMLHDTTKDPLLVDCCQLEDMA